MHTNTLATVVYWISRAQITTTRLTCFCFSSAVWGHIGAHSNKHNTWPMSNISDRVMQISIENIHVWGLGTHNQHKKYTPEQSVVVYVV